MSINQIIERQIVEGLRKIFDIADAQNVVLQKTKREFTGDFTFVVFPFVKAARKSPAETADLLGKYLTEKLPEEVVEYNVIQGFLNLVVNPEYWKNFVEAECENERFGEAVQVKNETIVLEYSSPNTNKPLHLGHIRNNLLGWSAAEILKSNGYDVKKVNIVNDRGIHICKSMLAWQKWGDGETPQSSGMKGDHLIGKYYVLFDRKNKEEIAALMQQGLTEEAAAASSPLMQEAREMLRQWEAGDESVRALWSQLNAWTYEGFDATYRRMGVDFDEIQYESNTYLLGKELVEEGLRKDVLFRKEDGSVWIDLTADGLDEKLLLRSDGTSVYMTQDLGTALMRHEKFHPDRMIYVVGNEQDYHFEVLKLVLKKLGYGWSDGIYHLSYGMVELPHGKMKSREGTVVDADDLMDQMCETARQMSAELGKLDEMTPQEGEELCENIAMAALKYFILKVDPKKKMLFIPEESVDFNGNTGPFMQYTHARIKSLWRKAQEKNIVLDGATAAYAMLPKEIEIAKLLHEYPETVAQAGENCSPALIANYVYELAKEYNQFYQETPILREPSAEAVVFRLKLSLFTAQVIKHGMKLLGIKVPEKM